MHKTTRDLLAIAASLALGWGCSAHGALDKSFGTGGIVTTMIGSEESGANGIAIQDDGKIVAAGYYETAAGDNDFAIARYNPDGSLDPSFNATGVTSVAVSSKHDFAQSVAIQQDGKIVAAGGTGHEDFALIRLSPDGSLDPSFGSGGIVTTSLSTGHDDARDIDIQADGKIVVGGQSGSDIGLARYMPDGTLDPTFDGDGIVTTALGQSTGVSGVAVQSDGKIVAAGSYRAGGAPADTMLVRYLPDGTLDASFDGDGIVTTAVGPLNDGAHSLVIQPDGRIVVAGNHQTVGGDDFTLVRYLPNGGLDSSFGSGGIVKTHVADGDDTVYAIVLQPDGKLIAAGDRSGSVWNDIAVARYQPDGSLDTSYGKDGIVVTQIDHESTAYAAALQADGKLVVAGQLIVPGDLSTFIAVRYLGGACALPTF